MADTKKPMQGSNLKSFYWGLGVLAVIGIALIAFIVLRKNAGQTAMAPVVVPGAEDPQALVAKAQGVAQGPDAAPAKMLVFSDYECPYCGEFAYMIEPTLVKEFVEPGKLQLVFYDFPLGGAHKYSFLAARAARCAGDQGKFWQYHDLLFGKQSEWSAESNVPMGKFLDYGNQVGLNADTFKGCVQSDKYQDIVSANHTLGERLGVNSTPTIFVNGRRVEGRSMEDLLQNLRDVINREAGASATPAATTTE
ncbi:MAG TPA: thioredoxin domain-containing protein [Longimicrobiales bacterium]